MLGLYEPRCGRINKVGGKLSYALAGFSRLALGLVYFFTVLCKNKATITLGNCWSQIAWNLKINTSKEVQIKWVKNAQQTDVKMEMGNDPAMWFFFESILLALSGVSTAYLEENNKKAFYRFLGSAIIMWNSDEEEDDCLHGAVILTDDAIHHSQFQDESSDIKNRNHIYSKWAYKKEL